MAKKTNFLSVNFLSVQFSMHSTNTPLTERLRAIFKQFVKSPLQLLFLLWVMLFTGCAFGYPRVAPDAATHIKEKAGNALAMTKYDAVDKIYCVRLFFTRYLVINLNQRVGNYEESCLKVLRALARDPAIPDVDSICVKVDLDGGVQTVTTRNFTPSITVIGSKSTITVPGQQFNTSQRVQRITTDFACIIKREDLLKGEEPRVVIRDSCFVSGPATGERSDSPFLEPRLE